MKNMNEVKDTRTYIKNITDKHRYLESITVEHRSNNPKRDFLFVNKKQCKHIPCKTSGMIKMCKTLADEVNAGLSKKSNYEDLRVLVIGFAETATAIGTIVGNNVDKAKFILHTTREDVPGSKQVITFEETHSHATTQKLLVAEDSDFDFNNYNYILFVEDEISTGNTILNFINAFEIQHNLDKDGHKIRDIKYGVASICNWQNKTMQRTFEVAEIDTFALITGEIDDIGVKMLDGTNIEVDTEVNDYTKGVYSGVTGIFPHENVFFENRTGHCVNRTDKDAGMQSKFRQTTDIITKEYNSARVIGTEECMEPAIMLADMLENNGLEVVCHSTTRSKIDVLKGSEDGIKHRYHVPSAYEFSRDTYIYNLENKYDCTVLVTDSTDGKQTLALYNALYNIIGGDTSKLMLVTL
mgnify:FL=1